MRVILGVTGCIAAYKSVVILRLLQKSGFEVFPVMTRHAQEFITPLTLEKLSGNKVICGVFDDRSTEIEHIALARRSDLLLMAPATANLIGKMAHGIADDFLSTLYLSTTTPVVLAPAMNVEMWRHPATQNNLQMLRKRGVVIVEPEPGYLACGEEGEGRLAQPESIVQTALEVLRPVKSLLGKKILVTAGPTIEDIDPVRFISNRSSGKMGYAIAHEAAQRGATVTLITGPTYLPAPSGVRVLPVRSAVEMRDAVLSHFADADVVVMAAAVSDFTPVTVEAHKIKKATASSVLQLHPAPDILEEIGKLKQSQFLVGFAAETQNPLENARLKLREKRLDLVVLNDVSQPGVGFQSDYNQITVISPDGECEDLPLLPKHQVAQLLWDRISKRLFAIAPEGARGA
ncbi:MAG: bifunctional phosphopantothenoylcysteine decarboxylase/phosphopantothenate--cysteine ligase CoaBC [Acidobacteria bacterium]|nr:bifunctional phosphopantothenoylcysteine decarboxylase/phosphopantothenate--cysteine ligase CoaBC [Acidobacteriota bacterium]